MKLEVISSKGSIREENLNPYQYTVSLLKEGFRAGLIDKPVLFRIQEHIMLILRELIIRYTKGESTSVKVETAEGLLNSIHYSLDAYLYSFKEADAAIAVLKSTSIKEIYEKGLGIVTECVAETKEFYKKVAQNMLDVPLEVYNTSVRESFSDFFNKYNVVFGAHETVCTLDYPLIFDDMNMQGIFYIRQYLEKLETETQFCRFFNKEGINRILAIYGRAFKVDYREAPVNLFEILVNNSIFSILAGNGAGSLTVSKLQFDMLKNRLNGMGADEIDYAVDTAVEELIHGLNIEKPELVEYIHRYKAVLMPRFLNAAENDSLLNVVMVDNGRDTGAPDIILDKENRMSDSSFRNIVRRIKECSNAKDKAKIIKTNVHSITDFMDILNADCLFGNEYTVVFDALSDMELSILGRMVLDDAETEWQEKYAELMRKR
ncbi:MAG: DUF6179 domain-containing protein [Caulobacteraceae bacterium]